MRSASGAGSAPLLKLAVAAQSAEAAGLCVAIAFNAVSVAGGHTSLTRSNAVAFIVFEAVIAAGVAAIALGLARVQPWSRTPGVLTQGFTLMIAVWLLQAHDYGWGVPALLLALAGFAGLLAPASLRALARPPR